MSRALIILFTVLVFLNTACNIQKNIPLDDHPYVPDIHALAKHFDLSLGTLKPYEQNSLISFSDGSYILEYVFDNREGHPLTEVYYSYIMEHKISVQEARNSLIDNISAFDEAFEKEDFKKKERPDLVIPGDEFYCAEYYHSGRPAGSLLVARFGNSVVTIYINATEKELEGFYTDFLYPYLERTALAKNKSYQSRSPLKTL
ncbi:hypothetical protein [Croceimicrobium sp.]|uniref:hypothetical protein n=1 Tax=Croceimicrobium sp. TaxID=2828340 RepID=UPI003BA9AA41